MSSGEPLPRARDKVVASTDGSCLRNPNGFGGVGVLLRSGSLSKPISYGFASTTNNRMELVAVAVAFEALKRPCSVLVRSDSRYAINTIEGTWKRRKNKDLFERIDKAMEGHEGRKHWDADCLTRALGKKARKRRKEDPNEESPDR